MVTLAVLAGSSAARAQTPADAAASGGTPVGAPAPPSAAESEARQRFVQASALFDRGNYDAALVEFQRVYDLLAGSARRYVVLFNIGQCHERLFRYHRALEFYRRYLAEGGPDTDDAATVRGTIRALEGLLATIAVVVSPPEAEVYVDDHPIAVGSGEIRVPGGRHVVEARAPGFVPARREVALAARLHTSITLTLTRAGSTARTRLSPAVFAGLAGAGAAALAVGIGLGISAVNAGADLRYRADPVHVAPGVPLPTDDDRRHVQRLAAGADAAFGVTALFAAGALVTGFFVDWRGGAGSRREDPRAVAVVPAPLALGAGACVLGVAGRF